MSQKSSCFYEQREIFHHIPEIQNFFSVICRPDDSRMLVALGEVYLRSGRLSEAQKCFLKAFKVGDVEGTALMLLGRLADILLAYFTSSSLRE